MTFEFEVSFKCYQCGRENTVTVQPTKVIDTDADTVTLHYADTIYSVCPHCGQKYAIPNNQQKKVVSSNRRNPNWKSPV